MALTICRTSMPSTRQTTALSDGDLSDAGNLEHELELAEIDPAKLSDRIAVTLCDFEAEKRAVVPQGRPI